MKPPPLRHVTLSRVLVLALTPSLSALALGIYNLEQANADRAHSRSRIDAEICATIAKIPGDLRMFESEVGCPRTKPVPLPTTKATPTPTPAPQRSTVPPAAGTPEPAPTPSPPVSSTAAVPRVGKQLAAPDATRTAAPRPTPTVTVTAAPGGLARLLGGLLP